MKFKSGDKVKIISGAYKGAIGSLIGSMKIGDKIVWLVQPNTNADVRAFFESELELV